MAHKKKHSSPIPPDNQAKSGGVPSGGTVQEGDDHPQKMPFQEQDPKRRLGGFEGAGEHSRQQPSALNDGQQHSK